MPLKYNLKIALRNIIRHKLFSFIHIAGLAISVASCLIIFLFVNYELTYDQHHEHYDRIARIATTVHTPEADDLNLATSPSLLANALMSSFPEVEATVRMESTSISIRHYDNLISEPNFTKRNKVSLMSFLILL